MPLKTFWLLHKNVDRIEAGGDYRQLQTIVSATSSEGIQAHSEKLMKIIGTIADIEPQATAIKDDDYDRAGFEWLKQTSGKKR